MIYLQDSDFTLHLGDVLDVLREMPSESVDCVITSPPFWGLRDYGSEGQLGLEPTPEQYVERMTEVFREVRRVLAAHGTCWLNMGDSYASGEVGRVDSSMYTGSGGVTRKKNPVADHHKHANQKPRSERRIKQDTGLKPKDLCGIPWRLAFALQADGWYLRSDIVWSKPNPMPESVTDRPTKAHEYVFLLTKSPRYFFDQEAVREKWADGRMGASGVRFGVPETYADAAGRGGDQGLAKFNGSALAGRNIRSVWEIATQPFSGRELFGDGGRITSPDCPVHGDHPVRPPTAPRDERAGAPVLRTRRIENHLAQEQLDGLAPTEQHHAPHSEASNSDSRGRDSSGPAMLRSTASRRRAFLRGEDDTASEETLGHTSCTASSSASSERDDSDSPATTETPDRIPRTSTLTGGAYSPPGQAPHGNARGVACTCKHIDHFATFPEELVRRCLLAGCPEQVCGKCGKVRERVVELGLERRLGHGQAAYRDTAKWSAVQTGGVATSGLVTNTTRDKLTVGFTDCGHDAYHPGTVLDPFMGSGTTALVARKHSRRAVGIELNAEYCELIVKRTQQLSLLSV